MTGAGWYPLAEAERLVVHRIGRAVTAPPPRPAGARWLLPPFAGLRDPPRAPRRRNVGGVRTGITRRLARERHGLGAYAVAGAVPVKSLESPSGTWAP